VPGHLVKEARVGVDSPAGGLGRENLLEERARFGSPRKNDVDRKIVFLKEVERDIGEGKGGLVGMGKGKRIKNIISDEAKFSSAKGKKVSGQKGKHVHHVHRQALE
jgi:hypothetical protein